MLTNRVNGAPSRGYALAIYEPFDQREVICIIHICFSILKIVYSFNVLILLAKKTNVLISQVTE